MVNMGQITVDRKNSLIGNRFQNPIENQHSEDPIPEANALKPQKQLSYTITNKELEDELLELRKQNERILQEIQI